MTDVYAPPAFQFYPREWLTDTTLLTLEQKGALMDLRAHAWLAANRGEPPCSLPNDDAKLARLSGLGLRGWLKVGADIRAFFRVDGGRLVDDMLLGNRLEMESYHRERSEAGRKGNAKRWGERSLSDQGENGSAIAERPNSDSLSDRKAIAKVSPASATATASASKSGAEAEGLIADAGAVFPHNSNGAAPPAPPADAGAAEDQQQTAPQLPADALRICNNVPDAKYADARLQLEATLSPQGARLGKDQYVRAASPEHLAHCCRLVLGSPPDKPEQLARWVLLKLRDTFTEWRARDDKRAAATVPPEVTAIVRQAIPTPVDELDASLLWLVDHPDIAKEIDALGAEKWREFGDSAKIRRQRYDWQDRQGIERWRAAGSPMPLATASTGERS